MDPYRDNNLVSRVNDLETQVKSLNTKLNGSKGTLLKGLREGVHDGLRSGAAFLWSGGFVLGMAAILMFPQCATAMKTSPEELKAQQEAELANMELFQASCQAMNMSYVGYDDISEVLTCGNESEVVMVDLDSREVDSFAIHVAQPQNQ